MHETLKLFCEKLLNEGSHAELIDEINSTLQLHRELNQWQTINELLYRLNMSTFENSLMSPHTVKSK